MKPKRKTFSGGFRSLADEISVARSKKKEMETEKKKAGMDECLNGESKEREREMYKSG